ALGSLFFGFDLLGAGPLSLALFLLGCFLCSLIIGLCVCALVVLFGTPADTSAWATVNPLLLPSRLSHPRPGPPGRGPAVSRADPLQVLLDDFRTGYGFPSAFAHPLV